MPPERELASLSSVEVEKASGKEKAGREAALVMRSESGWKGIDLVLPFEVCESQLAAESVDTVKPA